MAIHAVVAIQKDAQCTPARRAKKASAARLPTNVDWLTNDVFTASQWSNNYASVQSSRNSNLRWAVATDDLPLLPTPFHRTPYFLGARRIHLKCCALWTWLPFPTAHFSSLVSISVWRSKQADVLLKKQFVWNHQPASILSLTPESGTICLFSNPPWISDVSQLSLRTLAPTSNEQWHFWRKPEQTMQRVSCPYLIHASSLVLLARVDVLYSNLPIARNDLEI